MDRPHKGRSDRLSESSSSNYRSSILPSVKFPSLWKLDTSEGTPHHGKSTLLILRLTSPSFLHTVVEDEARHCLYTIRTVGNLTTVMRSDPWEGMTKTADIRWPEYFMEPKGKGKKSDGVQVQMRGNRWVDCETFLKTGSSLSAPRKFSIPNYPQSLKWREAGCSYWCTTPSVKGPVAILDPAVASVPAQLQIFETLHDKHDTRPMLDHHGVSIVLLDYILVTSLLLVTDPQDWENPRRQEEVGLAPSPDTSSSIDLPGSNAIAAFQWRKVVYGEPIFPKRQAHSTISSDPSSPISDTVPPTPTDVLARAGHGMPSSSEPSLSRPDLSSSSDRIGRGIISSPEPSRPTSPAMESAFLTTTNVAALSHTYLDPSLYSNDTIRSARPEQSNINNQPPSVTQVSRPHSTPPQPQGEEPLIHPPLPNPSVIRSVRSPSLPPTPIQARPPSGRPLPRPPDASVVPRVLRHVRSQHGIGSGQPIQDKRASYGQRALPSPPPPLPSSSFNIRRVGPVVDAGPAFHSQSYPSQTPPPPPPPHHSHISPAHFNLHAAPSLYADPVARSRGLAPLYHLQKAPDGNNQARWMGAPRLADDDAISTNYDVPPPPYSSINFNE